ncbi:MAG: porin [Bdellovibrionales bacterium]|nr:porin [Bdellovibrionales bacterium]
MRNRLAIPLLDTVRTCSLFLAAVFAAGPTYAEQVIPPSRKIVWGGFIDGQYAFDFNSPPNGDRAYTTQPARSNEFNINLAYLEVKAESSKTRSRLSLQAGTSVQSNYSSEPARGTVSGGTLSRHLQEARVGYQISEATWIDAGVFFAPVGSESFVSRDNLTLTRSLVADYSPYYLSGVKLSHSFSDSLSALLTVTNGWQNISENNTDKSVGAGLEYTASTLSFSYVTLVGSEVSADLNGNARGSELRHFHDFIVKSRGLTDWEWVFQFDIGFQRRPGETSESQWLGTTLMSRYSISADQKISFRFENYKDPDQIIIVTGRPGAFDGMGGSIGFDQALPDGVLWRTELRYLKTSHEILPKESNFVTDGLTATTSLAMSF